MRLQKQNACAAVLSGFTNYSLYNVLCYNTDVAEPVHIPKSFFKFLKVKFFVSKSFLWMTLCMLLVLLVCYFKNLVEHYSIWCWLIMLYGIVMYRLALF